MRGEDFGMDLSKPLTLSALIALALCAAPAYSQTVPGTQSSPPQRATPLDGVTVAVPRTAPVVVSTFPAVDAVVAPGVIILKVTFDQAMDPDGWSYAKGAGGDYPDCLTRPRQLNDHKTFVLLCTAGPKSKIAISLNATETAGFVSLGHRIAPAYEMRFTTSDAEIVKSLPAAMTVAGLKEDESPVQGSRQAPRDAPSISKPPAEPTAQLDPADR